MDKVMFWKKTEPDFSADLNRLPPLPGEQRGADFNPGNFNQGNFNQGFDRDPLSQGQKGGQAFGQQNYNEPLDFNVQNDPGFRMPAPAFTPVGPAQQPFQSPSFNPMQQPSHDIITSKNLEVVSSKIDALSAQLDSMNQRLQNIERIAIAEERKISERRW